MHLGLILLIFFLKKFFSTLTENYTFAFFADIHAIPSETQHIANMEAVVKKINEMVLEKNLKFVFIGGDFTDTSIPESWENSKSVAEKLTVQWFPMLGNHDIFYYKDGEKEPKPTGDLRFSKLFQNQFSQECVKIGKLSNYVGDLKVLNPEYHWDSYFQNFVFEYNDFLFIVLDWNCRDNNPKMHGPSQYACLHDFEGGTFKWFEERIKEISNSTKKYSQILFLQHQPYNCNPKIPVPCKIMSFDPENVEKIHEMLKENNFPFDLYYGNIAGHMHQWLDIDFWDSKREFQVNAVRREPCFALVTVSNGKISNIEKIENFT